MKKERPDLKRKGKKERRKEKKKEKKDDREKRKGKRKERNVKEKGKNGKRKDGRRGKKKERGKEIAPGVEDHEAETGMISPINLSNKFFIEQIIFINLGRLFSFCECNIYIFSVFMQYDIK